MAPHYFNGRPILCAVLDASALGATPADTASALFGAGVDWIQLRDRSLEADAHRRLTDALLEARDRAAHSGSRLAVILNKRIDIALSTGADGVHLGVDALAASSARLLLPRAALIGVSLHSIEEVQAVAETNSGHAAESNPSYAHLAPIWDPISKPASRLPLGLDLLAQACALGPRILAQGGLDPDRAARAIAAGAAGIAVTGILAGSGNPVAAIEQLRAALDREHG